jgi:hypothetical protein
MKDDWNREDMSLPFIGSRLPEANDLWELAAHDDSVGALLALPFADAAAGSLLMLHLEELFPTIRFPEQKGFDHITARYIRGLANASERHTVVPSGFGRTPLHTLDTNRRMPPSIN